jgi:hypothetical protein
MRFIYVFGTSRDVKGDQSPEYFKALKLASSLRVHQR